MGEAVPHADTGAGARQASGTARSDDQLVTGACESTTPRLVAASGCKTSIA
jgi:hypothetical protein